MKCRDKSKNSTNTETETGVKCVHTKEVTSIPKADSVKTKWSIFESVVYKTRINHDAIHKRKLRSSTLLGKKEKNHGKQKK